MFFFLINSKLLIRNKFYMFLCIFSLGVIFLFIKGLIGIKIFKISYHTFFLFHIFYIINFIKKYIIRKNKVIKNFFLYYLVILNLVLFFSNMNLLFNYISSMHTDRESMIIHHAFFYTNFSISHYRDYFVFLIFLLGAFFYLFSKELSPVFRYFVTINSIIWFLPYLYNESSLSFIISFLCLVLMLFLFLKYNFFKDLLLKKNIVIFFPLSVYSYLAISGIYGIHSSIDERFRQFYRNFNNTDFIYFPIIDSNFINNFSNAHNDFFDIFYCFGLFSLLIFFYLTIFVIKIFKSNILMGSIFISTFFIGGLTQNNLLNPYLSINFLIVGTLFTFLCAKSNLENFSNNFKKNNY